MPGIINVILAAMLWTSGVPDAGSLSGPAPEPVSMSTAGSVGAGQPTAVSDHPSESSPLPEAMAHLSAVDREASPTAIPVILEKAKASLDGMYCNDSYRFHLQPRWIPSTLARLPADAVHDVTMLGSLDRYTGFHVVYEHRGRRQEVRIQLKVDIDQWLPVARELVTAGTVIGGDHLDMRWVNVPRDRGQLVTDPAVLHGKTLRRTLAAGEPVRTADITTEFLVEVGQAVQLVMTGDGTVIELTAVARQNGALGDDIRVYSDDTRRTYLGRVEQAGRVQWIRTL